MEEYRSIVSYTTSEYGRVRVKLAEVLEKRHLTRNGLGQLMGVKFETVDRYFRGDSVERVDLDFLAKVCYVLDCRVEELLEYEAPKKEKE